MFFCSKKRRCSTNQIFLKDMVVEMEIGAYANEKGRKQRVRINITAEPSIWPTASHDNLSETVSYDILVKHVQAIANGGHIHLVETVAERIAEACLSEKHIRKVTVCVEKLDIYPFAVPGVEIIRAK